MPSQYGAWRRPKPKVNVSATHAYVVVRGCQRKAVVQGAVLGEAENARQAVTSRTLPR